MASRGGAGAGELWGVDVGRGCCGGRRRESNIGGRICRSIGAGRGYCYCSSRTSCLWNCSAGIGGGAGSPEDVEGVSAVGDCLILTAYGEVRVVLVQGGRRKENNKPNYWLLSRENSVSVRNVKILK